MTEIWGIQRKRLGPGRHRWVWEPRIFPSREAAEEEARVLSRHPAMRRYLIRAAQPPKSHPNEQR